MAFTFNYNDCVGKIYEYRSESRPDFYILAKCISVNIMGNTFALKVISISKSVSANFKPGYTLYQNASNFKLWRKI